MEIDFTYKATLENIKLTKQQDELMVCAIKHIQDTPNLIKKTTRWQFWFRKIWDSGKASANEKMLLDNFNDLRSFLINELSKHDNLVIDIAIDKIEKALKDHEALKK